MSNNKNSEISLFYAEKFYKNLDQEEINIIEDEGLDFIINIIRKVESLGPNIKLFEGPETVFLEKIDGLPTIIKDLSSTIEHGHYRSDATNQKSFLSFSDAIVVILDNTFDTEIKSTTLIKEMGDGEKTEIKIPGDGTEPITFGDNLIEHYKNKSQVNVVNLSDDYYLDRYDDDKGEWKENVSLINIPFPQLNIKAQGLIPLVKKFIREDLNYVDASFQSKKINSINVVPTSQSFFQIYINLTSKEYEEICNIEDDDTRNLRFKNYYNPIQSELDNVERRLNELLANYCDLETGIILNCRTKIQHFNVISKKRVDDIVHQIGTLKNLTNKQHYNSNNQLWQSIQRNLLDAVYDLDKSVRLIDKENSNKLVFDDLEIQNNFEDADSNLKKQISETTEKIIKNKEEYERYMLEYPDDPLNIKQKV